MKRSIVRNWLVRNWNLKSWTVFNVLTLTVFASGLSHAATFRGEIGDSSCALNVHSLSRSHQEMLKAKNFGSTSADCARHCVAHQGSSFVLVVKEKVYRLDNQQAAERWAGQIVIVTGELNEKKDTITVGNIQSLK
ncbi:MAG TPA: hypothetical protein VKH18_06650 [Terriglobales bacterium]|nr:hypothetical protein [Terriglobales bacterium]